MRTLYINVDYKDPMDDIKRNLEHDRTIRNLHVMKRYDGSIDVSYTVVAKDPNLEITKFLETETKNPVRSSKNYSGAQFTIKIDDKLDERVFKKDLSDKLRKMGYRMH